MLKAGIVGLPNVEISLQCGVAGAQSGSGELSFCTIEPNLASTPDPGLEQPAQVAKVSTIIGAVEFVDGGW